MTTTHPVAATARAAAQHLGASYGARLAADVEAELHAQATTATRPDRYANPVSVASLIVAIATLAWTVYADLREKTPRPSSEAVARRVRLQLRERGEADRADAGRITEIVVAEIIKSADGQE